MSKPEVMSEESLNIYNLKDYLGKIKKRDGELSFRGNKTDDYLNQFCKLSVKKANELKGKLEELEIPRLKTDHINKMIDIMPENEDEMKAIVSSYTTLTITKANQTKILKLLKEYE